MNKTPIEWVRNSDGSQGYTWNPITGCLGPNGTPEKPNRCSYCFANKLAKGRLKERYLSIPEYPYDDCPALLIPHTDKSDPFVPRFWRHRLSEPSFWCRKPRTIFVCSMGELFSEHYPASWLGNILHTFYKCPQHTFLVLTKNPPRDEKICWPRNVWFGVTINKSGDWLRLRIVEDCEATKKFISFEPLLDDVLNNPHIQLVTFNWIIIGAQTKPSKLPKKEWVEHIVNQADLLGISVFLKNNLKPLFGDNLRQEFPRYGGVV